jgi:hypothetical protein
MTLRRELAAVAAAPKAAAPAATDGRAVAGLKIGYI